MIKPTLRAGNLAPLGLAFLGGLALGLVFTHRDASVRVTPTKTTQEVWDHHIAAWNKRDLDAIIADYTDDSVAVLNNRIYRGLSAIRGLFQRLFATFDRATEHVIDPAVVKGKLTYLTWHARIDDHDVPFGSDSFFIENGHIAFQTITSTDVFLELFDGRAG